MVEMKVNGRDIAEYNARLLGYSVGNTVITQTTGISYNANFPKLFHRDYGLRTINVTIVFRPQYLENNSIVAKLHAVTMQKALFDAIISCGVVEIELPDGFYYRCLISGVSNEIIDGESLEVTYTLNGIRHLSLATIKDTTFRCSSTVQTDCRLTITAESCSENSTLQISINSIQGFENSISVKNINVGDVVIIDGINCTVTKNGQNIFTDTDIITFPYLVQGENFISISEGFSVITEYYPTFI